MKIKHIVYLLLLIGLGVLIFYRVLSNKEQKKTASGQKNMMGVNGIVIKPQDFSNIISLSGTIEADEQVDLRSEVMGIAEKIYFDEGTKVSKGQVLVKINDVELKAQAVEIKTRQGLTSENERRAKLLLEKEAISQEEYDIASADFKASQAQTQLINAQIGKTSVRAPFSGTIGLRNISPGTYVTPDLVIARLVNSDRVKITFSIPEKYASQVKPNSEISFIVPGHKEKFTAKIYAQEPAIDVGTRTLRIRAMAENKKGLLLPGTFANVLLPLDNIDNAFMVPTEAIVPVQNGKKVFIYRAGTAKEAMVETGTRTDKDIVVLSGLKEGDTVLTTGVLTLKEGSPVKVSLKEDKAQQ